MFIQLSSRGLPMQCDVSRIHIRQENFHACKAGHNRLHPRPIVSILLSLFCQPFFKNVTWISRPLVERCRCKIKHKRRLHDYHWKNRQQDKFKCAQTPSVSLTSGACDVNGAGLMRPEIDATHLLATGITKSSMGPAATCKTNDTGGILTFNRDL